MENNKNHIDHFFKENLEGLDSVERKGNWELMNHLLDEAERKKKRRKLLILFLVAGLLVSSGLYFVLTNPENAEMEISDLYSPGNESKSQNDPVQKSQSYQLQDAQKKTDPKIQQQQ